MNKPFLKYGGIAMIVMAALIAVLPFVTHTPVRFDFDIAALSLIIGVMSIRKALHHN